MQKSLVWVLIALLVGAAAFWYFKNRPAMQPMVTTVTEQKSEASTVSVNVVPQEVQKVAEATPAIPQDAVKVAEVTPAPQAPAAPVATA